MALVILFITVEMHIKLEIQRISKFLFVSKLIKQTDLHTTWNNEAETTVQIVTIEIVKFVFVCLNKIYELRIILCL